MNSHALIALALVLVAAAAASREGAAPVGVGDISTARSIDSLSVTPDGTRFAVAVKYGDSTSNRYVGHWFVASVNGGALRLVAEAGELLPNVSEDGHATGEVLMGPGRWSPDGKWLAYIRREQGAAQLWRSSADGGVQEIVTANRADVRTFAWRHDGKALYFTTGAPREEELAQQRRKAREGYRYDEDLDLFSDFMKLQLRRPIVQASTWIVTLDDRKERLATQEERNSFGSQHSDGVAHAESASTDIAPAVLHSLDEDYSLCDKATGKLICVRQSTLRPAHVVSIDLKTGAVNVIADPNQEFGRLRKARVERLEWNTPRFPWSEAPNRLSGLYAGRAYGYIIYPPDFDATQKYPVFIEPYVARGFNPSPEHALLAYAANGFIVLNTAFPAHGEAMKRLGGSMQKELYSKELGFPHLTMLMESTLRALDVLNARGFIDPNRVGIGGVSHGTFVPLYMVQKYDRIAAISISSPTWGPHEYYWGTRRGRQISANLFPPGQYEEWRPKPVGAGQEFWTQIDIADHVDAIEAPVLMNLAAHETYALLRLIRHLADENKPYDAYVYPRETHIKWQPAHIDVIMRRNLDWFRFWLQDIEDPDPAKAGQYVRWRQLRQLQCRNPRSRRDYCHVTSMQVSIAH